MCQRSRVSCVNHVREHVALTREHPRTARRKGVGAREYVLASVKFKSSGTVYVHSYGYTHIATYVSIATSYS